jgi:hypothetical protein
MARVIYSALIEKIQGSIGGTTFQQNAYGFTIKKKPNVVNKRRADQYTTRTLVARVSRAWQNLTDANRTAWDSYAAAFPRQSKNNPASVLSGFNYFQAVTNYRFAAGLAVLASPSLTQFDDDIDQFEVILSGGVLYISMPAGAQTGAWYGLIYLSQEVPVTVNFVKPRHRFIIASNDFASDVSVSTPYLAKFGALPSLGNFVAAKLVTICTTNGQINTYEFGRVEVIA